MFFFQVVRKIVHDEFNIVEMKNNIAVLKFDHDLLSFGARPICLWNQNVQNNAVGVNQNNGVGTVTNQEFFNSLNVSDGLRIAVDWHGSRKYDF